MIEELLLSPNSCISFLSLGEGGSSLVPFQAPLGPLSPSLFIEEKFSQNGL